MAYQGLAERLSGEQYEALKRALELGRWPDGRLLSSEQKAHCMAAIIHWETQHLAAEQRTGHIDTGSKRRGQTCDDTQVVTITDQADSARGPAPTSDDER